MVAIFSMPIGELAGNAGDEVGRIDALPSQHLPERGKCAVHGLEAAEDIAILRRATLFEQGICVLGAVNDDAVKKRRLQILLNKPEKVVALLRMRQLKQRPFALALDDHTFHDHAFDGSVHTHSLL